jgi:trans-feruloyl-CoA hydratase/vanillin synthase
MELWRIAHQPLTWEPTEPWEEHVAESYRTILIEREAEGVTFVILNRPEKRNAMSPELHREMCDALETLEIEDATKIVVITGAGESFSAGQDIKLYFRSTEDNPKARAARAARLAPLALGEAVEIPEADDRDGQRLLLRRRLYAALRLRFRDRCRRGDVRPLGGELGNPSRRHRRVECRAGDELSRCALLRLHGETFNGKQAATMRLVNFSVPRAELKAATLKLAHMLLTKSPAALRYTKECIRAVRHMDVTQAADYLNAKSDALRLRDPEKGRAEATKQFLDEKAFKPGLQAYKRKKTG